MKILVINSGSSSIKFQLFDMDGPVSLAAGIIERIGEAISLIQMTYAKEQMIAKELPIADHLEGFALLASLLLESQVIQSFDDLDGFGHRIVHGGEDFFEPAHIDHSVLETIEKLFPLAPLHNPSNLIGVKSAMKLAPDLPHVAVFDTAFHQTLPPSSYLYALPFELYQKDHIRRYGFHGTSHHYVAKEAAHYLKRPLEELNLITLHLGNGASATAIQQGKSIDTSMGMTPLEGLMMGTRSGDLDPAILLYLLNNKELSVERLDSLLNKESGLKGVCGENDFRVITDRARKGDRQALLAIDLYTHRLKKYIGAYSAVLGKVDAIIFTGGVGEHAANIRQQSCEGLWPTFGLEIDPVLNELEHSHTREISSAQSRIKLLVIPTNEELEIALQTQKLLNETLS